MSGQRQVLEGTGDEGVWMDEETIHAELYYPRVEGARKKVTVGMTDTRVAQDLTIQFDFVRDGWVITREVLKVDNAAGHFEGTGEWVEVAFIPALTELEQA